jgi:uncharacterized protein (TIGR03067 family)
MLRAKKMRRDELVGGSSYIPSTLAQIEGEMAVPFLTELLDYPDWRIDAGDALGNIGFADPSALAKLQALAAVESPAVSNTLYLAIDRIRIQGTWVLSAIEKNGGRILPTSANLEWTIHGDRWTKGLAGGIKTKGFLTLETMDNPRKIHITVNPSHNLRSPGPMRYEIDGDTLKLWGDESDVNEGPLTFEVPQRTDRGIIHWKKVRTKRLADPLPKFRL